MIRPCLTAPAEKLHFFDCNMPTSPAIEVEDAIIYLLHTSLSHQEKARSNLWIMFFFFFFKFLDDWEFRVHVGLCGLVPAELPSEECGENQGAGKAHTGKYSGNQPWTEGDNIQEPGYSTGCSLQENSWTQQSRWRTGGCALSWHPCWITLPFPSPSWTHR